MAGTRFTPTEQKIIDLIKSEAISNAEIALRLGCSERTIETHIRHILGKTGLKNRLEIAVKLKAGD